MEEKKVIHEYGKSPEPCKIKLIKQSKAWAWEISKTGNDFDQILKEIDSINEVMKAKYGPLEA